MSNSSETQVLAMQHDTLIGHTRFARRLALREPTRKLARMLVGSGASSLETYLSSLGMPPGLSPHCNREISGAQATHKGDSRHVVSLSA